MQVPGSSEFRSRNGSRDFAASVFVFLAAVASGTDWPQYRGPTSDGVSPDPMATTWATNSPGFVVWTNASLTNGFSSFAVSQGRAFALFSRNVGGSMKELCGAVDAATGANLWATVIDSAPWNLNDTGNGGAGSAPYNKGDGPRGTPASKDGRVLALSGNQLHLVCLNATNGSVIWSNNLASRYGASKIDWENAASPCLEGDLIFVNLNTATDGQTLAAFRMADGSLAWSTQNEGLTHTTPAVATLEGVRQVIFATTTGLVSLNCTNGAFLWKYPYPFSEISTSMGASPLVYSNIVYCTAGYGRGAAAARITYSEGAWTVTQLFFRNTANHRSIWMTPVCYQGYIYTLCGENSTFLTTPLNCIELSTGNLKWSTNGFGMGGLILVDTNLLVLREDGQLVLVRPNPNAYTELARYRAFQFTAAAPGKCWNSPAYSEGRIYARSTRGGISLNVAPPALLPVLGSLGASNVTTTAATLLGRVNPNGAASGAWFEWGTNTSYGSNTAVIANLTGSAAIAVSNVLTGLEPNSTYHFRLVATNSAGVTRGDDQTFTTQPLPPQLQLLSARFLNSTQLQLVVTTTNGAPIDSSRLSRIEVRATNTLGASPATWPRLTNGLVLTTNGLAWMTNLLNVGPSRLFYITVEQP
ncbi:MAG: PQQ-binding-like beta-propeller repeat protein [Verrucomicrobia bacterium]|nr:PQQ-binding-like beta-propeller repeat protein [Verrucomicrobiota bacterium]